MSRFTFISFCRSPAGHRQGSRLEHIAAANVHIAAAKVHIAAAKSTHPPTTNSKLYDRV